VKLLLPTLALLVGCGGTPTSSTPSSDDAAAASASTQPSDLPPVPEGDVGDGIVEVSARVLPAGRDLEITFVRPGRSGCYRQGPVETTIGDHVVTHTYTTRIAEGASSQALVPGGFHAKVSFPSSGAWTGKIVVDGEEVGQYFVDVGGT
jgi:hypothetical protein